MGGTVAASVYTSARGPRKDWPRASCRRIDAQRHQPVQAQVEPAHLNAQGINVEAEVLQLADLAEPERMTGGMAQQHTPAADIGVTDADGIDPVAEPGQGEIGNVHAVSSSNNESRCPRVALMVLIGTVFSLFAAPRAR